MRIVFFFSPLSDCNEPTERLEITNSKLITGSLHLFFHAPFLLRSRAQYTLVFCVLVFIFLWYDSCSSALCTLFRFSSPDICKVCYACVCDLPKQFITCRDKLGLIIYSAKLIFYLHIFAIILEMKSFLYAQLFIRMDLE